MISSLKHLLTVPALVLLLLNASLQAEPAAGAAHSSSTNLLTLLQGTWRGVMVGQESDGKITVTIRGNSLHFHRDTNFWFETNLVLPPGTTPQQLHATITGSAKSQSDSVGKTVLAIVKVEDGMLTLATKGDEPPARFDEESVSRYEFRRTPSEKSSP